MEVAAKRRPSIGSRGSALGAFKAAPVLAAVRTRVRDADLARILFVVHVVLAMAERAAPAKDR